MASTGYKAFSAFSMIGVVMTGVLFLIAPEVALKFIGFPDHELSLPMRQYIASCHFAWGASKLNSYLSGGEVHKRYFRINLPVIALWFISAFATGDVGVWSLPGFMIFAYIYFGWVYDYPDNKATKKE